jgi:hypothetical protein
MSPQRGDPSYTHDVSEGELDTIRIEKEIIQL